MKKLLVIDGNSILNRAFYGIRPMYTKSGQPTNAVYGFVTIIKKHLDALQPDYTVCAFDLRAPTFRHKMYDGYKATRHAMPEELAAQLDYAKKTAAALGLKVIECEGWEADDVLGTVSGMADSEGGIQSYILTGDRDSLQLITDTTSVILVKTKEDIVFDGAKFREEYGITPTEFIDVKALMGDSSDNIPGVAGIGEKTALKLISATHSLDGLYADENLGGAGKSAKEKLIAGKESAYMSYTLSKISREAPVGVTLNDMENPGYDKKTLSEIFTSLEFSALSKRFELSEIDKVKESLPLPAPTAATADILKSGMAIGASGETLYASDGEKLFALPLSVETVNKITFPVVCHDYKKLYTQFSRFGAKPQCSFDTMTASYLLSPGESSYPVDKSVIRYLSEQPQSGDGSEVWYAARLYKPLSDELEKAGMTKLLHEIEIPLSPVLAEMEMTGFRLDCEGLREYLRELAVLQGKLAARIYMAAGREFNINSPKQLGEVLFDELGLPAGKKTKTGYSTDADTLEKLREYHTIVADVLDWREVAKLSGTYGENLIALCDENSKIHTRFNQTGTATGRLSSVDPNLQNIPVRGQLGKTFRRFFTATDDEHILLDADYSQIELRLLAHIANDSVMIQSYLDGTDIHASTAARVFNVSPEAVTKELRSKAKAVNFGIVYGIGDYSLSQDIHVSRKAAREYIDSYLANFTGVDRYLKQTVAEAKKNGYTTTMFARRRPIPELSAQNKNLQAFGERVAMNSPIQGSAADIMKLAMINTAKKLSEAGIDAKLILQVHDELIVESAKSCADKAAEILHNEMENAVKTKVPLSAKVTRGQNWLEAK